MDSNRSEILAQLASGQISADQAAEQLRGQSAPPEPPALPPGPGQTPPPAPTGTMSKRWLRVRVSDLQSGRQRVSVNLPLSWVSIGLRLGAKYSPEVAGIDPAELMAAIASGEVGQIVDVEDMDSGEHVQVFIE